MNDNSKISKNLYFNYFESGFRQRFRDTTIHKLIAKNIIVLVISGKKNKFLWQ